MMDNITMVKDTAPPEVMRKRFGGGGGDFLPGRRGQF